MAAELPKFKNHPIFAVLFFTLLFSSIAFLSQQALGETTTGTVDQNPDVTTDPLPASLEDVITALGKLSLSDQALADLTQAVTDAVDSLAIEPQDALDLIETLKFGTETFDAASADVLNLILTGLVSEQLTLTNALALIAGSADSELLLSQLQEQLDDFTTPEGITNAISNATSRAGLDEALSSELLDKIDELIDAGTPPGILVRVIKQSLKTSNSENLIDQLDALKAEIELGASPGQAANRVKNLDFEAPEESPDTEGFSSENESTTTVNANQSSNNTNNGKANSSKNDDKTNNGNNNNNGKNNEDNGNGKNKK